jgi:hypothetical protein
MLRCSINTSETTNKVSTNKAPKMFKFASLIKSIISTKSITTRQNDLDRYITSKNPSSPAEVDHWAKEYLRKNSAQGWLI